MKTTKVFNTILTLTVLVSGSAGFAAETPLKLSNAKSVLHGAVDGGAKVDVMGFYVPAGNLVPGKSLAGCQFPEDKLSPNDAGKFVKLTVTQSKGQYTLAAPMTGLRGHCEYVLDTLYVNYDSGKIYQNLSILTQAKVDSMNRDLTQVGLEAMEVTKLQDLKQIFCEFNTPEQVGLCQTTDGSLPEPNYLMANAAADYVLDVRNLQPSDSSY